MEIEPEVDAALKSLDQALNLDEEHILVDADDVRTVLNAYYKLFFRMKVIKLT